MVVENGMLPNGATTVIEEIPHVRSAAIGVFCKDGVQARTGGTERHLPLY